MELEELRIPSRLQEGRPLPPWSGRHSLRHGRTRQNSGGLTPPSHTINRAELAGIGTGLQLGHTHLLTDSACSLRLIQGYLHCPLAYRHNIHRDTLLSITHTLKTRCDAGIRTHLYNIKAHNHSLGNDLADTLANQDADGHPPDTTYTTG